MSACAEPPPMPPLRCPELCPACASRTRRRHRDATHFSPCESGRLYPDPQQTDAQSVDNPALTLRRRGCPNVNEAQVVGSRRVPAFTASARRSERGVL